MKSVCKFCVFFQCIMLALIGGLVFLPAAATWAADAQKPQPEKHFFDASAEKLPFEKKAEMAETSKDEQPTETVSADIDDVEKLPPVPGKTETAPTEDAPSSRPEAKAAETELKTEPAPDKTPADVPGKTEAKKPETGSASASQPEKSAEVSSKVEPSPGAEAEVKTAPTETDTAKQKTETPAAKAEPAKTAVEAPAPETTPEEPADAQDKKVKAESPAPAEASKEAMRVKVTVGNVRDDASLKAKINAQLKRGDAVSILEKKGEWFHVQLQDGETGWVHTSILSEPGTVAADKSSSKKEKIQEKRVTVNKGNIRQSPSLKAKVINQLRKGRRVSVTGKKGDWYHVALSDGKTGWAHKIIFAHREKAPKKIRVINGIRIDPVSPSEEKVSIFFNGSIPPKFFLMDGNPVRLVCDFYNTRIGKGVKRKNPIKDSMIKRVRTYFHKQEPQSYARVVFDLNDDRQYRLEDAFVSGRAFVITIKTDG